MALARYDNPWGSDDEPLRRTRVNNRNVYDIEGILLSMRGRFFRRSGPRFSWWLIFFLLGLFGVFWVLSGFYIVNPEEQAVKLTFGKYAGMADPGLRYHFPFPIGHVDKVKVAVINRNEIGYSPGKKGEGEGIMLTGDENIVNANFEVQWRIKDAYKFLYKVRDYGFGLSVKGAAESAMRDAIGQNKISFILRGEGRAKIASDTKKQLQEILDGYDMGVEVLSIQMKKVDPPEKVIDAFRDVQSARADKEREINQAYSYRNDALPRARGEAEVALQGAQAYKIEVINRALGDTTRFTEVYNQYKINPEITRVRMRIEMLEDVYRNTEKIVADDSGIFKFFDLQKGGVK
ncbi:FtsH protease activity modulator HflK [Neorickettsia sp. 179522]|uniref:FtsH protease activity modulator HflK n=1 Tax=Neorickettsia sp. 179522 TaxID=1714371 RepID=UPI0007945FAF|nr:FtsH protease activity modulator HflK [Neorickettsia sp. 179522]KYH12310.1 HflK protein [Neorickettsia sp. 179522]